MDTNFDLEVSVEEIKGNFQRQSERIATSRDIAKTILSSVSVLTSVIGGFTAFSVPAVAYKPGFIVSAVAAGLFFIALIFVCVKLLMPVTFFGPIDAKVKAYEENVFGKDERNTLLIIFSSYVNVVATNEKELIKRVRWIWAAGSLMILVVIALFGMIICK